MELRSPRVAAPGTNTSSSGDTTRPATYLGTQQRVLPEINSPLDPSQLGKSVLQRCMAPGCVEVSRLRWNFALPESLYPALTPRRPGTHHSRRPTRGHSSGCCRKSTARHIRHNSANPHCKGAWHLAALRVPGSDGTSPYPKPIALPQTNCSPRVAAPGTKTSGFSIPMGV